MQPQNDQWMRISALLSIFHPSVCPMCGEYSEGFCNACIRSLPRTEQAQMRQNETEMVLIENSRNVVGAMKAMRLKQAAAFLFYEKDHPIRHLIHRMKYAEEPNIGYTLGRMAAIEMQYTDFFDGIDVIIPMPLHPKRLRERGYNQSEYIARGISDIIGVPVDTTHVIRSRNTPKQALQTGEERKRNVADAFAVHHPEQLYHKHILIVDDLITTGETVRSCLRAMRYIRGAHYTVFALCKAK